MRLTDGARDVVADDDALVYPGEEPAYSIHTQAEAQALLDATSASWRPHWMANGGRIAGLPSFWAGIGILPILFERVGLPLAGLMDWLMNFAPVGILWWLWIWAPVGYWLVWPLIAVFSGWAWVVVRCNRFVVRDGQLEWHFGVFNRREEHLEMQRVRDYKVERPLELRLLGLGNIKVVSQDLSTPLLVLPAMSDCRGKVELLRCVMLAHQKVRGYRELGH